MQIVKTKTQKNASCDHLANQAGTWWHLALRKDVEYIYRHTTVGQSWMDRNVQYKGPMQMHKECHSTPNIGADIPYVA